MVEILVPGGKHSCCKCHVSVNQTRLRIAFRALKTLSKRQFRIEQGFLSSVDIDDLFFPKSVKAFSYFCCERFKHKYSLSMFFSIHC